AVDHFGETGELAHVARGKPRLAQRLVRAAGGDELDAVACERTGEINERGLVGHGNERARDALELIAGHRVRVSQRTRTVMPCREVDHSGNCGSALRSRRTVAAAAPGEAWAKLHCTRITLRARP